MNLRSIKSLGTIKSLIEVSCWDIMNRMSNRFIVIIPAAILVFEQCNNNLFANNSATHSGDGFFLWAGQTTMDTGEGGSDTALQRNLILDDSWKIQREASEKKLKAVLQRFNNSLLILQIDFLTQVVSAVTGQTSLMLRYYLLKREVGPVRGQF